MLGLADDEAIAYRALVAMPAATPAELAERLQVHAAEARRLLHALEQQGLLARNINDAERFTASAPSLALGALLVHRQNEIRLAEADISALDQLYRTAAAERGTLDVVEVVRGPDAIRHHLDQLQLGARADMMAFVRAPDTVMSIADNTAEDVALSNGVRVRVVVEQSMLEHQPGLVDEIARVTAAGEEVRIANTLPMKLIIVDHAVAMLPVIGSREIKTAGALLVHRSSVLDALIALFESVWAAGHHVVTTSRGVDVATSAAVDGQDGQILSLLLAGITDAAVANQLGLSLRTVQRRVHALMELAGVDTRIQLGWQAAARGWVHTDP